MSADVSAEPTPKEAFLASIDAVIPLIREEWPAVDESALTACEGDFDKIAKLLATTTGRTKVALRRDLEELLAVAQSTQAKRRGANGSANESASASAPRIDVDEVIAALRRLESFASEEAKRVSHKVAPLAGKKVRDNLWVSLIFALGLGLILGLWLNGRRRS
jgi:ElaB/YqjD/DUF883 family membrane-anchored ribosome-binding protein